jgi:ribulose-phosphate 3-epimerase
MLKKKGIMVGMSICPSTPVDMLEPYIRDIDMVLMMSVVPGKSGQTYIEESTDRLKEVKAMIDRLNHVCKLEVDGGITMGRLDTLEKIGVDYVVMGSKLYKADKKERKEIVARFDG